MKRWIKYFFIIVVLFTVAAGGWLYANKDKVIQQFVEQANGYINTPVHVKSINISPFENFPFVAISMHGVVVEESYSWSTDTLLNASRINFSFNPIDLLRGYYEVSQVQLVDAQIWLKVDRKGQGNYNIFKASDGDGGRAVKLNKIELQQVGFSYDDKQANRQIRLMTPQTTASLHINNNVYDVEAIGDVLSKYIKLEGNAYLEEKRFHVNSKLAYNHNDRTILIAPSLLEMGQSNFIVEGNYHLNTASIDLSLQNDATNLATITALIPERYTNGLEEYNSSGDGYFDLKINGKFENKKYPSITVNFGLSNATITHPELSVTMDSVSLKGKYESSDLMELKSTALSLDQVSGVVAGNRFQGQFAYRNFIDPFMELVFKGALPMQTLLTLYPKHGFQRADGVINMDVTLSGKLADLKKRSTMNRVVTTGQLDFREVGFIFQNYQVPFAALNGAMLFNNNDLAFSGFSGKVGSSDFVLNGMLKNFTAYLLLENQPIGIEADLVSRLIDLDELLSGQSKEDDSMEYAFSISPDVHLKFNCNIGQLKFRNFLGDNIRGDLSVKDRVAFTDKIELQAMGGTLSVSGSADAASDSVHIFVETKLDGIAIDQLFLTFENFKQDFLTNNHLKGDANANIVAVLAFDKKLNFAPKALVADVSTTIIGGELNNFAPLMALSNYVDEAELRALRFSELTNEIHIENETIYLPTMEVNSNASNITIGGTHTFDQHINYNVIAPLNNKKKIDKDAAFGAIEEDNTGKMKVYLKIEGATDDFEVNYDTRAMKKEVSKNLKKEIKELKDAFRTKGEEHKKEVELEDDEYFDW